MLVFWKTWSYCVLLLGLSSQDGGKPSLSAAWDFNLFPTQSPCSQYESIWAYFHTQEFLSQPKRLVEGHSLCCFLLWISYSLNGKTFIISMFTYFNRFQDFSCWQLSSNVSTKWRLFPYVIVLLHNYKFHRNQNTEFLSTMAWVIYIVFT